MTRVIDDEMRAYYDGAQWEDRELGGGDVLVDGRWFVAVRA